MHLLFFPLVMMRSRFGVEDAFRQNYEMKFVSSYGSKDVMTRGHHHMSCGDAPSSDQDVMNRGPAFSSGDKTIH
jgi:hypothetical protein